MFGSELVFCLSSSHILASFSNLPLPFILPHVHIDLVVPPPGCGRSVTDFWGWGAHRAQLRCPDDVSDVIYERETSGGA
jgi:hypothetical protein